jgi:hypothetical protein
MGLTLEFLVGDAEKMAEAMRECDYELFDDPECVSLRADFSLHLEPRDLNSLSHQLAEFVGQAPMELRPHLSVCVDEVDRGLLLVGREWVSYVAAVPDSAPFAIADRWAASMRQQYDDPEILPTDAMVASVSALVALCKTARQHDLQVVHVWMA